MNVKECSCPACVHGSLYDLYQKTFGRRKTMENFWVALSLMGKGMLGIFTVIILIMLIVMLLSKITK